MLFSFEECIKLYKNPYQIEKMLQSEKLYKLARGIYSDKKQVSELEIIAFRYPEAVFTMDSAFYYHGLTDVIPEEFCLATAKDAAKIRTPKVKQFFHRQSQFEVGITETVYQNVTLRIYDKERMLIELIRNKNSLPFDYYKELIGSYRQIARDMDIEKLQDHISAFPGSNRITAAIQLEVL